MWLETLTGNLFKNRKSCYPYTDDDDTWYKPSSSRSYAATDQSPIAKFQMDQWQSRHERKIEQSPNLDSAPSGSSFKEQSRNHNSVQCHFFRVSLYVWLFTWKLSYGCPSWDYFPIRIGKSLRIYGMSRKFSWRKQFSPYRDLFPPKNRPEVFFGEKYLQHVFPSTSLSRQICSWNALFATK